MKIQALLFMCNDFDRAKFTLEKFNKYNPDIPISVINSGGESPINYLKHIPSIVEYVDTDDLWHRKTHCKRGGFGLPFLEILFNYGLNENFTHTLYLETDVLTNRKITIEPKYDMSGVMVGCGPKEQFLWDYLNIAPPHYHTGCGATIFRKNFFIKLYENSKINKMFYDLYDQFPEYYYMDLILTLVAKKTGLSCGHWAEVSDVRGHMINDHFFSGDLSATLVHGYKI
jgi:hypothetical protein